MSRAAWFCIRMRACRRSRFCILQISFEADGRWFENNEYLRELERGLDFREDLYSPGILHFTITPGERVELLATLEAGSSVDKQSSPTFADPLNTRA